MLPPPSRRPKRPRVHLFEVAFFEVPCDKLVEKKRNYHNPTRQRGIFCRAVETPQVNPSLTFRIVTMGDAQLQKFISGVQTDFALQPSELII